MVLSAVFGFEVDAVVEVVTTYYEFIDDLFVVNYFLEFITFVCSDNSLVLTNFFDFSSFVDFVISSVFDFFFDFNNSVLVAFIYFLDAVIIFDADAFHIFHFAIGRVFHIQITFTKH